ncbi:hypothetical protein, partial [Escherichia coli]
GQVENMSVEGLFVHGGDLWRLNTPLSCLQPPQQGKTHKQTVLFQQNLLYILQWLKWWFLPMLGRYNTLMLK